ncbi:hypothetical protein AGABI1DRAFT_116072 [Agaricus bisporus var. burnettii JB137-S8]|uniref:Uncharacterized protein n=1 Tax=Agaricus bisporus var. burnettii (strain JB137-S8 / ATCC MYA-4627 / FGSC 10392) TaxID=597362 RepID=K5WYU5_AGABU|nr:uncharacterized protein AGABI1DRAFT_116072 [Agaricus bisporus var. burnettii JB137-S8]EKM76003.1 hypothetical protein AGABI1DRAFT_116072 [Agaricus bisporus var. burnettii JB137-S8]
MFLTSTYKPNARADIPVIIVCYGDRKVFMLKANTYSNMVNRIRQKFDIQMTRQLCIQTVALDVCRGSNIEVDEDVWSVLKSSLDEIVVVVSDDDLDENPHNRALARNETEMETHDGRVSVEGDEARVKEEFVENWLEQQNEVDDVPPAPSVYSEVEYEDAHEVPPHTEDENEYQPDDIHEFQQEEEPERSPRVQFDAEDQGSKRDEAPAEELQRPSSSADERFQVSINGPDLDQTAEIKTRGKHLVRKVLAAVCKTFNLDYERASLYVVTYTIIDDRVEECLTMCPPDWSIARCGITSLTELKIQLESPSSSETAASNTARRLM